MSRPTPLAIAVLTLALAFASNAAALTPVTLQLKWHHQFQFAGYYAAVEKGYYAEAGLEVLLREAESDADPVQVVLDGGAEFGVGTSDLVVRHGLGEPVVVLAAIFQHSPLAILVKADSPVQRASELQGRRLMIESNSAELLAYLNRAGVDVGGLEIVPHHADVRALTEGRVDGMSVYITDEPYALHEQGLDFRLFRPIGAGIDFYGDNLFTRRALLKDSPELVRDFRDASLRGWRYAMEHPEEIARLIRERYSDRHSLAHLMFEAEQMRGLVKSPLVEIGYVNAERWRQIAATYAAQGLSAPIASLDGFLYNPAPENGWLLWALGGTALVALLFGGIGLFVVRLNRRLAASEDQARILFDVAPMAALVWDPECRIARWNRQAERAFGWGRDEVLGRTFFEFLVPADQREAVRASVQAILAGRGVQAALNWNLTRDGRRILCEWSNTLVRDASGAVIHVVSMALDITERHRLEARLRQSEQNYRTLLETAPFPVVVTRITDGTVLYINHRAAGQFNIPFIAAVGEPAPDYWVDPAERTRMLRMLEENGEVRDFEARLKDRNGRTFWVYLSAARTTFGGDPAVFVAFADISERKRVEDKLRESEQRYRLLAENALDVIWTLDLDGRFTYVSPSAERLCGYTAEEMVGRRLEEAVTEGSRARVRDGLEYVREYGDVRRHVWELEFTCENGTAVWTDVIVNVLRDEAGRVSGLLGITRDVSERRRVLDALHERVIAIEAAAEAVVITDAHGTIEYVNPAFTEMTGFSAEEAVGQNPRILKSGLQPAEQYRRLWDTILAGEVYRTEVVNRRKDGSLYTEAMAVAPVIGSGGTVRKFVAIKHDISERKRLEQELARMAHYDLLTGLPNRALFFDRLGQCLARAQRTGEELALLFIDLDGFKGINDELGHKAGDLLLQGVAHRLSELLRASDTVARMGGDEFTVLLPGTAECSNAELVAGKILQVLSEPFDLDGQSRTIGASIGVSIYPEDGGSVEALVNRADDAMYVVKRQGKNGFARACGRLASTG